MTTDLCCKTAWWRLVVVLFLLVLLSTAAGAGEFPLTVTDDAGCRVTIPAAPRRIVSLVPGVTEILVALGAEERLVGITLHDRMPASAAAAPRIVGGYASPSLSLVKELQPELVFTSSLHRVLKEKLSGAGCRVVEMHTDSIADAYDDMRLIGRLVDADDAAAALVDQLKQELALVHRKLTRVPAGERRRVMRLMGREVAMSPGDDSFQNELIAAAGGIPPTWGRNGAVVMIGQQEFQRFNPQFLYGCDGDRLLVEKLRQEEGWNQVAAVVSGDIRFFPCDLTCRASVNMGAFVAWLASSIYPELFSDPDKQVLSEAVIGSRSLELDLAYVSRAQVLESTLADSTHRTLVVDLAEPMTVLSTLEGMSDGVRTVGNHFVPPPAWELLHQLGAETFERRAVTLLGRDPDHTSLLITGADMRNLAVQRETFRELTVYALVTAGVRSNAMRQGAEEGYYYEPGTINIVLLTNRRLSPRAMTRAMISATEGKTAALQDLDIRSSKDPGRLQATGTGTDNIIVVEGRGSVLHKTGGHSKMGELIARAVYQGVMEAVSRQNKMQAGRSVFHRLQERGLSVNDFLRACRFKVGVETKGLASALEELLLEPRYRAFVETAMAVSDAWERGQVADLGSFRDWCRQLAGEIAGRPVTAVPAYYVGETIPEPLQLALESLLAGCLDSTSAPGDV
ncbi:MAG: adenosylcobinamide amidohydrolase [Deltaproteobacteria bacterium]|nr:adenosylcobinamide amidohydrolase [Candidatus Anaeroferrophillus wilburensis]MBN2887825.1 adenosylcobinamide amidohydrolase [Deltaproteobacteria bacterium]